MKLVLCIALLASPFVVEGGGKAKGWNGSYRAPALRSDQGEAGSFGSLGSGVGGTDDRWGIAIKGKYKALEQIRGDAGDLRPIAPAGPGASGPVPSPFSAPVPFPEMRSKTRGYKSYTKNTRGTSRQGATRQSEKSFRAPAVREFVRSFRAPAVREFVRSFRAPAKRQLKTTFYH